MSSGLEATFSGVPLAGVGARRRRLLAQASAEPGRVDEAGADGVDPDLGRQRAGERQGHGVERALGGGIGDGRADPGHAGDRGRVDHAGRPAASSRARQARTIW